MIKTDGILFDLDGTLWDATFSLVGTWHQALKDEPDIDRTPSREDLVEVMGMTGPQLMKHLFPHLSPERGVELFDKLCQVENVYLREHGGILYPKLEETLAALKERVPLGIVSNCGPEYIPTFFAAHRLGGLFADWECIGRTGRPKGENIRLVAERLGLKAPVYLGDTQMDKAAADQAGVPFIHAAYGFGAVPDVPFIHCPADLLELLEFI